MLSKIFRLIGTTIALALLPTSGLRAADPIISSQRDTAVAQQPLIKNSAVQRAGFPQAESADTELASDWGDWGDLGDLGDQVIMKRTEAFKRFSAFADLSANYTGNVALTRRNAEPDGYLIGSAGVNWRERLGVDGAFDFGIQESLFRYDKFREFDFDSLDLGGGVSWNLRKLWSTQLFARYNYNRINSGGYYDEKLYDSHAFRVGLQKVWDLSQVDYILVGGSAEVSFADPTSLQRNEYALYAAYGIQLTRTVAADLLYRAAVLDYTDVDRRDLNQTVALGLHYQPVEPVQLNISASASFNRSDHAVFEYSAVNVGGGASFRIQF